MRGLPYLCPGLRRPQYSKWRPALFLCQLPTPLNRVEMPKQTAYQSEEYLVHAFQNGDEQALAVIYEDFHPVLSLYANRFLDNRSIAEEIASNALAKTWQMHWKLDSYGAIRAYLYKVVQRDSLTFLRKEKKRTQLHQAAQLPDITTETPFEQLVRTELYHLLHNALKELSPGNQKVISMYFLEGKNTNEIAQELNLHPSTVKTQKTRGLEALRKLLLRKVSSLFYFLVNFFFACL